MTILAVVFLAVACGSDDVSFLPPGAKEPDQYQYQLLIGESNGVTVHVYTDTKPVINSSSDGNTIVTVDGPVFCPAGRDRFGSEPKQPSPAFRNNYCSGEGFYQSFEASVGNGRASVLDRGE